MVADMVADMEVDKVADMVANMAVDKKNKVDVCTKTKLMYAQKRSVLGRSCLDKKIKFCPMNNLQKA